MSRIQSHLQYILMAGGGIILAGIIAVLVIYVRPEESDKIGTKQDIRTAEQNITDKTTQKNEEKGAQPESSFSLFEQVPEREQLSMIQQIIDVAGLTQELQGEGPFTFFFPSNQAFEDLSAEEKNQLTDPQNKDELAALITYHIVPGNLQLEDFTDGENVKTLQGEILQITVEEDTYQINDTATVTERNKELPNGTLHIINTVLTPQEPDPENPEEEITQSNEE